MDELTFHRYLKRWGKQDHVTSKFVERTGFDGIAPLPNKVRNAVTTARKLQDC